MEDKKIRVVLVEGEPELVELTFPKPIPSRIAFWLFLALGYRRGNCLLMKGGKVIGVRCRPEDWESIAGKVAPETLQEFRSAVEGLRRDLRGRKKLSSQVQGC